MKLLLVGLGMPEDVESYSHRLYPDDLMPLANETMVGSLESPFF